MFFENELNFIVSSHNIHGFQDTAQNRKSSSRSILMEVEEEEEGPLQRAVLRANALAKAICLSSIPSSPVIGFEKTNRLSIAVQQAMDDFKEQLRQHHQHMRRQNASRTSTNDSIIMAQALAIARYYKCLTEALHTLIYVLLVYRKDYLGVKDRVQDYYQLANTVTKAINVACTFKSKLVGGGHRARMMSSSLIASSPLGDNYSSHYGTESAEYSKEQLPHLVVSSKEIIDPRIRLMHAVASFLLGDDERKHIESEMNQLLKRGAAATNTTTRGKITISDEGNKNLEEMEDMNVKCSSNDDTKCKKGENEEEENQGENNHIDPVLGTPLSPRKSSRNKKKRRSDDDGDNGEDKYEEEKERIYNANAFFRYMCNSRT
eukprot:jgi/Bigna1/79733/fgenesh1_pg.65_\